jgi:hypothetical protein
MTIGRVLAPALLALMGLGLISLSLFVSSAIVRDTEASRAAWSRMSAHAEGTVTDALKSIRTRTGRDLGRMVRVSFVDASGKPQSFVTAMYADSPWRIFKGLRIVWTSRR